MKVLSTSLCLFFLLLAGCDSDPQEVTDTNPADDTASVDMTPDEDTAVAPCDPACEAPYTCGSDNTCTYDTAVADACDPACRSDIEKCIAGSCVRLNARICYIDEHCLTVGETCIDNACTYTVPEPLICPGSPGCETSTDTTLYAGAAARTTTSVGFELAKTDWINDDAVWEGNLMDTETFHDCGRDQLCPGDTGYTAPDDGEGDGMFQGLWIAGFDHSRPAFGIHDDTWARAIVLKQGNTTVALVSLDAVGFFYSDIQKAIERLPASSEVDHVILSSTHTHEAADTMGQWGPGDIGGPLPAATGRDPEHFDYIYTQIADAIAEAEANLEPARLFVGQAQTGRVGLLADGRDPQIFNDDMVVIRVANADNTANIATLVNWHSHPEALWSENQEVSSDFPHYLREALENGLAEATDSTVDPAVVSPTREGLGGLAIYFSGSLGGLIGPGNVTVTDRDGTQYADRGTFERTQAMGEVLAEYAFQAIEGEEELTVDLKLASEEILLEVNNTQFHAAIFNLKLFDRPVYNFDGMGSLFDPDNQPSALTAVSVVTLGDLTFYTAPGELFPESAIGGYDGSRSYGVPIIEEPDAPFPPNLDNAPEGPYINERMPGKYDFILGLGHDEIGYLVPEWDYVLHEDAPYVSEAKNHYEETNSVGPKVLTRLEEKLDRLLTLIP